MVPAEDQGFIKITESMLHSPGQKATWNEEHVCSRLCARHREVTEKTRLSMESSSEK